MYKYLEYLNNPVIAGIFAALLVIGFAYIDKLINDRDYTYKYYIRLFMTVLTIVTALVYFIKQCSPSSGSIRHHRGGLRGGLNEASGSLSGGDGNIRAVVKKIGGDVYADMPDF